MSPRRSRATRSARPRGAARDHVAEDASDAELAHVRAEFAWLAEQGLAVAIGRAERSESRRSTEAA